MVHVHVHVLVYLVIIFCCIFNRNIVRNQGKWRENLVAVKTINKDSIQLTSPLRLEIKAMRDIRHNNVVQFIGASCEAPNVCILMEIAPKVCVHVHVQYICTVHAVCNNVKLLLLLLLLH